MPVRKGEDASKSVIFLNMGSMRQAQEMGEMKEPGKECMKVKEAALMLL